MAETQPKKQYGITTHQTAYTGGKMPSVEKICIEQRGSCHNCIEVVAVLTGDAATEKLADLICKHLNENAAADDSFFYDENMQRWRPKVFQK